MKPLISIIIPIYNTEEYIGRCLESILYNKEFNVEVICVNDGSKDASGDICCRFRDNDDRIKIINQMNQGVSVARNNGMKHASGEWVMFVDSDDILIKNYYLAVESLSTEYDIGIFDAIWGRKQYGEREREVEWNGNVGETLIPKIIRSESISPIAHTSLRSACIKAYKLEFLQNNDVTFPEDIKIGEDMLFNISAFSRADRVKYFPVDIYQEIDREGSATHSFIFDMIENDILFQGELKKRLIEAKCFETCKIEYNGEVKSGILRCLRKQVFNTNGQYNYKEKRKLLQKMQKETVYREALYVKDKNIKRNIILWLYSHRFVFFLHIAFRYFDLQ